MLRFNDGITIDTSGAPRKLRLRDGLYVVGNGFCVPVSDDDEADDAIAELTEPASRDDYVNTPTYDAERDIDYTDPSNDPDKGFI